MSTYCRIILYMYASMSRTSSHRFGKKNDVDTIVQCIQQQYPPKVIVRKWHLFSHLSSLKYIWCIITEGRGGYLRKKARGASHSFRATDPLPRLPDNKTPGAVLPQGPTLWYFLNFKVLSVAFRFSLPLYSQKKEEGWKVREKEPRRTEPGPVITRAHVISWRTFLIATCAAKFNFSFYRFGGYVLWSICWETWNIGDSILK